MHISNTRNDPSAEHICILMATYNGAAHLREQLASLRAQSHENWSLWVSDDGSTDATLAIVEAFQAEGAQQVRVFERAGKAGEKRGICANFLSLLCRDDLPSGYVALCDQDDIWFTGKLARAVAQLAGRELGLYAARTRIGLDPGTEGVLSPLHGQPASFGNALIQTIGGGNTMVLSQGAVDLMRSAGAEPLPAYHDWWLYLLISGAGGQIIYDEEPALFYRQHAGNHMGRNRGAAARLARLRVIFSGTYGGWVSQNLAALNGCKALLTPQNRSILEQFTALRKKRGWAVRRGWRALGIYRQSRTETWLMSLAAMVGKI